MAKPPTLADVARACGLSVATISKALSPHLDRCDLRPDTRERVIATAHRLGWSRNAPRSARARRRWHNIGVLWGHRTPQLSSYEHFGQALTQTLGDGYRVLITPVPAATDWKELQLSLRLDGAIALGHIDDAILADLERSDYPAVLLNRRTERNLHQILVDDLAGTTALVSHLIGLGHRHVVYLRNPWQPIHCSERDRLDAVRQVTAAAGATLDEVKGQFYDQVVARCRAGATAVVCNNFLDVADQLAALLAAGFAVPGDVSIGACHDLSWYRHCNPPLTAVGIPMKQMAEEGAKLLLELMAGRTDEVRVRTVLPETLEVRGSTGPAPRRA